MSEDIRKYICNRSNTMNDEEQYDGLDKRAATYWIFPTNLPFRQYQFDIVKTALFHNTLVSLPTGLGKTMIAAVLMHNMHRWYPQGKIVFMAPTRPLVIQQADACFKITSIPHEHTVKLTGDVNSKNRASIWEKYRVFYITPQILHKDLESGACPSESIRCLVFDEAHKARGKYAYCEIVRLMAEKMSRVRVLALSATPGSNVEQVAEVCRTLKIARIEIRTEMSADVKPYVFDKKVQIVTVELGDVLNGFKEQYVKILDQYTRRLMKAQVLKGNAGAIHKGRIFMVQKEYKQFCERKGKRPDSNVLQDLTFCLTLYHAYEVLIKHGLRGFLSFYMDGGDKAWLRKNDQLVTILDQIRSYLGDTHMNIDPLPNGTYPQIPATTVFGHPKYVKLREIVHDHFMLQPDTRVMIFCEFRDSVNEAFCALLTCGELVKPRMFLGQSSITQKQQLMIMQQFRSGEINTLVCTSVGEEGLDVAAVQLIVCFDIANSSPIRLTQRMGRTGRFDVGRIIMLVTEGREHQTLLQTMGKTDKLDGRLVNAPEVRANCLVSGPALIPPDIKVDCHKVYLQTPESLQADKLPTNSKRKSSEKAVCDEKTGRNKRSKTKTGSLEMEVNVINETKRNPTINRRAITRSATVDEFERLFKMYDEIVESCESDKPKDVQIKTKNADIRDMFGGKSKKDTQETFEKKSPKSTKKTLAKLTAKQISTLTILNTKLTEYNQLAELLTVPCIICDKFPNHCSSRPQSRIEFVDYEPPSLDFVRSIDAICNMFNDTSMDEKIEQAILESVNVDDYFDFNEANRNFNASNVDVSVHAINRSVKWNDSRVDRVNDSVPCDAFDDDWGDFTVVEGPVVERPVVERPVVDCPVVERPVVDCPVVPTVNGTNLQVQNEVNVQVDGNDVDDDELFSFFNCTTMDDIFGDGEQLINGVTGEKNDRDASGDIFTLNNQPINAENEKIASGNNDGKLFRTTGQPINVENEKIDGRNDDGKLFMATGQPINVENEKIDIRNDAKKILRATGQAINLENEKIDGRNDYGKILRATGQTINLENEKIDGRNDAGKLLRSTGQTINLENEKIDGRNDYGKILRATGQPINVKNGKIDGQNDAGKLLRSTGQTINLENEKIDGRNDYGKILRATGQPINVENGKINGRNDAGKLLRTTGQPINVKNGKINGQNDAGKLLRTTGQTINVENGRIDSRNESGKLFRATGQPINVENGKIDGRNDYGKLFRTTGQPTNVKNGEINGQNDAGKILRATGQAINLENEKIDGRNDYGKILRATGQTINLENEKIDGRNDAGKLLTSTGQTINLENEKIDGRNDYGKILRATGQPINVKNGKIDGQNEAGKLLRSAGQTINLENEKIDGRNDYGKILRATGQPINVENGKINGRNDAGKLLRTTGQPINVKNGKINGQNDAGKLLRTTGQTINVENGRIDSRNESGKLFRATGQPINVENGKIDGRNDYGKLFRTTGQPTNVKNGEINGQNDAGKLLRATDQPINVENEKIDGQNDTGKLFRTTDPKTGQTNEPINIENTRSHFTRKISTSILDDFIESDLFNDSDFENVDDEPPDKHNFTTQSFTLDLLDKCDQEKPISSQSKNSTTIDFARFLNVGNVSTPKTNCDESSELFGDDVLPDVTITNVDVQSPIVCARSQKRSQVAEKVAGNIPDVIARSPSPILTQRKSNVKRKLRLNLKYTQDGNKDESKKSNDSLKENESVNKPKNTFFDLDDVSLMDCGTRVMMRRPNERNLSSGNSSVASIKLPSGLNEMNGSNGSVVESICGSPQRETDSLGVRFDDLSFNAEEISNRTGLKTTVGCSARVKRPKKRARKNPFIDNEAEASSDDSRTTNDTDDDRLDSSFVDDEPLTQTGTEQMRACYLKSIQNQNPNGMFKIPQMKSVNMADICSQPNWDTDQYVMDSFVADTIVYDDEPDELEIYERKLKKTRKKRSYNGRLINRRASSDSEEEAIEAFRKQIQFTQR